MKSIIVSWSTMLGKTTSPVVHLDYDGQSESQPLTRSECKSLAQNIERIVENIEARKDEHLRFPSVSMTHDVWADTKVLMFGSVVLSLTQARILADDLKWGAKQYETASRKRQLTNA